MEYGLIAAVVLIVQPPVTEQPQAVAQQQHQTQPKDKDKKE
jgi:hypothetical protein